MPFIRYSIYYVKCNIPVKEVTNIIRVIGTGNTLQKFIKSNGKELFLPCVSYHITQNIVWLFYLQDYYHIHGGYYEVNDCWMLMYLTGHQIDIPIDREQKNLPIFYNSLVSYN